MSSSHVVRLRIALVNLRRSSLVDDRCYQQSNKKLALSDNESNLRSWMDLACL